MTAPTRSNTGLPARPESHSVGLGIAAALVFAGILSLGLMVQDPPGIADTAVHQPASDIVISVIATD